MKRNRNISSVVWITVVHWRHHEPALLKQNQLRKNYELRLVYVILDVNKISNIFTFSSLIIKWFFWMRKTKFTHTDRNLSVRFLFYWSAWTYSLDVFLHSILISILLIWNFVIYNKKKEDLFSGIKYDTRNILMFHKTHRTVLNSDKPIFTVFNFFEWGKRQRRRYWWISFFYRNWITT